MFHIDESWSSGPAPTYFARRRALKIVLALLCLITLPVTSMPEQDPSGELEDLRRQFSATIKPFIKKYCTRCHGEDRKESMLDLSIFASPDDVSTTLKTWTIILRRIESKEMPPKKSSRQPDEKEREHIADWIRAFRKAEATQNAGDPGQVLVRRLSNSEYNYTIRDLTGIDIRPTQTFPVDPANEAGFDNSGESLTMSPGLLAKYLDAARRVVEHLVLKPDGLAFAPHPVMTNTDRDKYCVKRIVQFYERQPTSYAPYFEAAWRFKHRAQLGFPTASIEDLALSEGISPKYLALIWSTLIEKNHDVGPLSEVRQMWRNIPASDSTKNVDGRVGTDSEKIRNYIRRVRAKLVPSITNLYVSGSHKGSQPFVLWKNRQYSANRQSFDSNVVFGSDKSKRTDDPDLIVQTNAAARVGYEAALNHFCRIFPDSFYVSERGRDYLDKPQKEQEKGRLLSAGFHSMMGYYRDDEPLADLILNQTQQQELNDLWDELDFVTSAPMRQYSGFLWFERTDSRFIRDPHFDFVRAEDKNATSQSMIQRLKKLYAQKAQENGGGPVELGAIEHYFEEMNRKIRWVENSRQDAEPSHLKALSSLAARAYRRILSDPERTELLEFYHSLRKNDGLSHEEAVQDTLVSILMSPHFLYRLDLAEAGQGIHPLNDIELASRLSYFLWSSMPDEELIACAIRGELNHPEQLKAQTRRMLRDDRVRGFATEFAGNWLDFRRFEEHNSVDRERFPSFTDELRAAMFEEPIRFFVDLVQNDRSLISLIDSNHTFVNQILASHYGMPIPRSELNSWFRVADADKYNRGGLLPMSVFLTMNAPGLRTSPVKRGYWVVRRLLGEYIPPPPPDVPDIPDDESKFGDLTLREMLAQHRQHESCASCHDRFDQIGLVFEAFGPTGEQRKRDLGGRPVVTSVKFPSGDECKGVQDLKRFLTNQRQEEFLDNLCRKTLSYALGRSTIPSDDGLIEALKSKLRKTGCRSGTLIENIVTSSQFLNKRGSRNGIKTHE